MDMDGICDATWCGCSVVCGGGWYVGNREAESRDVGVCGYVCRWCICGRVRPYQKCTVLRPTGLFHMRLVQDSDPSPAAVLWKRKVCLGRKNWRARKAGRAARKKLLDGDMAAAGSVLFWEGLVVVRSGVKFGGGGG